MNELQLTTEITNMATELNITFVAACQAMQSAASKLGNETMILKIHDIKMKSLN